MSYLLPNLADDLRELAHCVDVADTLDACRRPVVMGALAYRLTTIRDRLTDLSATSAHEHPNDTTR